MLEAFIAVVGLMLRITSRAVENGCTVMLLKRWLQP